jgi:hypothetical protein
MGNQMNIGKQMNMRRTFTILLFLFTAVLVHAQEITGVWQGHFRSNPLSPRSSIGDDIRYKFEVQIAQKGKLFEAVTYSYLSTLFYGKASATGTVNPKTGKVLLQEGKLLEFRDQLGGGVCIMTCFLQYSKSGDEEFLEGTYSSMSVQDSSNCGRGTVFLRRVSTSDFYKEPFVAKREEELENKKKTPAPSLSPKTPPPSARTRPAAKTPPAIAVTPKPATLNPASPNSGSSKSGSPKSSTSKTTDQQSTTPDLVAKSATPKTTHPKTPANNPVSPPLSKTTPGLTGLATTNDTAKGGNISKNFSVITPEVLRSRSNELVKTITVNTNEVVLNIYDDGAIDNDTISVFLDKKQVISHAMLTDRAIVLTLHMDESSNYHELVMVAENEGTIPPNTSLMIVKAGDQRYEVRITSTEQKNAVVIFKYEKPK